MSVTKKKKSLVIALISILSLILVLAILIPIAHFGTLFINHFAMLDVSKDVAEYYSDFSLEKGGYTLKTVVLQDDEYGDYVYFTVSDSSGTIVFDSLEEGNHIWRVKDFKEIKFANDSLDIIADSGDVGTSVFRYDNNSWGD